MSQYYPKPPSPTSQPQKLAYIKEYTTGYPSSSSPAIPSTAQFLGHTQRVDQTPDEAKEDEGLFAERGPFPLQIARFLNRSSTVQRKAFCVFCVVRGALWLSEGHPSAAPIWKQTKNGEDVIPPTKPIERLEAILRVADEVTYNTFPIGSVPSAFSFLKSLIRNVLATKKTVAFGHRVLPRTTSPYGSRQRGDYSSAVQYDLCPSQAEGARVFSEALALTGGLSERVPGVKAAFVEEAIRFCATMVSFATEDTLTVIDDILENHLLLEDEP